MDIFKKFALRSMTENKSRTLVTLFGIILSAAMLTAVTSLVGSGRALLSDARIADTGDWHIKVLTAGGEDRKAAREEKGVKSRFFSRGPGFSLFYSGDPDRPLGLYSQKYIRVYGAGKDFFENMPVELSRGRFPENSSEIILPRRILREPRWEETAAGDEISLSLGRRVSADGQPLPEESVDYNSAERIEGAQEHSFTVVGFYTRNSISQHGFYDFYCGRPEARTKPGILYLKADSPYGAKSLADRLSRDGFSVYSRNYAILRIWGVRGSSRYTGMFFGLAAILTVIIIVASVALIYNAFSISVSERKKRFATLTSVGASKKDIRRRVRYEALTLLAVGLPLGIISGFLGLWFTFGVINRFFIKGLYGLTGSDSLALCLVFSPPALGVTVFLCCATRLAAASVPARRAAKIPGIEAIRQTGDLKISQSSRRRAVLPELLFGFPGGMASRNTRRNVSRYISTVAGLATSVALFIAIHFFCSSLSERIGEAAPDPGFDLQVILNCRDGDYGQIYSQLRETGGVKERSVTAVYYASVRTDPRYLSSGFKRVYGEEGFSLPLVFLEDEKYFRWLSENGFSREEGEPLPVFGLDSTVVDRGAGNNRYYKKIKTFNGSGAEFQADTDVGRVDMKIAGLVPKAPFGAGDFSGGPAPLIFPLSMADKLFPAEERQYFLSLSREDPMRAARRAERIISGSKYTAYLYDRRGELRVLRSLTAIVKIFCYGFIALIGLICMANTANTVMTNVNLRRGEFAVMRSVGATKWQTAGTVALECCIYAVKALVFGAPVGVFFARAVWLVMNARISGIPFRLPLTAILLSALLAFLTVAAAGAAGVKKVFRDDLADALRNENL